MCKIGQQDRCKETGCEFSKQFGAHCYGEKIKQISIPSIYDLWDKTSFDTIASTNTNQTVFKPLKRKEKKIIVHIPPITKKQKIYNRSNGICYLCGDPVSFSEMTVDHVIPKSKGGGNGIKNLRATHAKCNHDKGDKIIDYLD